MRKLSLLHPFLFTLTSVLFLYQGVSVTISFSQTIRPLIWLWCFLALLVFPAYKMLKNWDWVGIFLTLVVFGIYYEQHIFFIVFFFLFIIFMFLFFYLKIKKRRVQIQEIILLLNILSFSLVLGGCIKFLSPLKNIPSSYYQNISNLKPIARALPRSENPDIYYIVLDGYANSEVLKNLYGYDNSNFVNYLQEKGFVLPPNAHSNYPKTALSIPSTLNMDYIQKITPGLEKSYFWWLMTPLINHSQTRIMLEEIGYESVSLETDWSITNNKTTNYYYHLSSVQVNEFENYLMQMTALSLLRPLLKKIAFVPSNENHGTLILYNFETLSQVPNLQGPKFVVAHIIAPHPPFVFDRNGHVLNPNYSLNFFDANDYPGTQEEYRRGYIEQIEFINGQVVEMINRILENSSVDPIIILQADHGSGMFTDFIVSENTCFNERFSPLSAYYLPNLDKNTFPKDITPVNIFRIIFNEYFQTKLPLLENQYFFTNSPMLLYDLEEISLQSINTSCSFRP